MKLLKSKEARINRISDKLTSLIAKKKLMLDNYINSSENHGKFDSLFTDNESENQAVLEKAAGR